MYKRVSGAKFWLLSCITFGIYSIVTWSRMTKNLNDMAVKAGEQPIRGYVGAFFLGFITFGIYPIVWMFKFYGLAGRLSYRASAGVSPSGTFGKFIMGFIPIYSFFWLAGLHNKLADAYERLNMVNAQ